MTKEKKIEEIKKCKNPIEAYYEAVKAEDLDYIKLLADEGNAISKDEGLDFDLESAEWIEHIGRYDKTNPMALAMKQYDFEIIDYFMEKHLGKRIPKPKKDSPIIQAWCSDELAMVDFLLEYYSKEDYISMLLDRKLDSQSPWCAFNEAVRLNDMSLLRYLVEEKKTSLKDCFSNIAGDGVMIHSAIFNRDLEMVKYLVEECKCNPYNYVPKYGTTVRYALEEKQSDILNYLITNCATQLGDSVYDVVLFYIEKKEYEQAYEIIEKSKIDVSALFCHLSYDGQESVFSFLKELYDKYDIDLSYIDKYGENALGRALEFKLFCDNKKEHEKVFSYLKELYSNRGIIIAYEEQGLMGHNALTRALDASACDGGFSSFDMDLIKYLVEECGFDVNKPDKADRFPLLTTLHGWKSGREQFAIGKYLIEHGADINVVGDNGQNVLHIIADNKRYGNEEFSWFLDKGVDYLSFDNNGESPLHKAAGAGKSSIVKKLVEECGVDPNYHKDGEHYPIHVAAYENRLGMVKWFIKKGSDINSKGRHGITPLFAAVDGFCSSQYSNDGSKLTLVRWLVDNGANLLCLDEDKRTVLHYAAAEGNMIVIKFFVEECHMNPALDCGAGTPAKIAKDSPWFGVNSSAVVRYLHKKEKEYNEEKK